MGGGAADDAAADAAHGAVPSAYYAQSVLQLASAPLPPGVPLYEDLTAGSASGAVVRIT